MNSEFKIRIANELVKIAVELSESEGLSKAEEFERIDRMNWNQLINYIRKNKNEYTTMSKLLKMNKFKKDVNVSIPLRGMRVIDIFRMLAKIIVIRSKQ